MDLARFRKSFASYIAYWGNTLDAIDISNGTLMVTICNDRTWSVFTQEVYNILNLDEGGVDRHEYIALPIQKQYEIARDYLRKGLKAALKSESDYPRERGSRRAKNELRRMIKNLDD